MGESFARIDLGAKEGFACGVSLQMKCEAVTRRIHNLYHVPSQEFRCRWSWADVKEVFPWA